MRLSETITIYLAVGAPFGVNYFQREHSSKNQNRARSILKAAGVGLLWPLMAIAAFLSRRSDAAPSSSTTEGESAIDERTNQKIAAAQQQLLTALDRVRELAQQKTANGNEELERSTRAVREGVEKYVGLTLALAEMSLDDSPASSEMELCRIAGREGDDLLLAGRCIHRRNVARLIAHQSRSRVELLHALAAVREIGGVASSSRGLADATAARQLSLAVLKFHVQAINLLTLLEDESAATSAARLLDAECARLRSLEATSVEADALSFTASSRAVV